MTANLYELFLLPIPYHTSSPDASPVTPGSPAAYTGIRAVFRLNQRKGVGAMLQSLGWAALGTGFTFLMTALGAAMVFFFAGDGRLGINAEELADFVKQVLAYKNIDIVRMYSHMSCAGLAARRGRNAVGRGLPVRSGCLAAPSAAGPDLAGCLLAADHSADDSHHPT